MSHIRKPSRRLTRQEAIQIKKLLSDGWFQNRIAARYDVNPGRISEIKNGHTFSDV
jgi:hypothetical protein